MDRKIIVFTTILALAAFIQCSIFDLVSFSCEEDLWTESIISGDGRCVCKAGNSFFSDLNSCCPANSGPVDGQC